MQDFESLYDLGELHQYVNTIIEVPKGSTNKVEYDRGTKVFRLDRVEPAIFAKPVNYGFIPQTTDEDHDPLDTLVITEEPLTTGLVVRARVVAVLNFVDDGENDHKIVCVPADDRNSTAHIKDVGDLNEQWKQQVEFHFNHYKDLKKPGQTHVEGWGNAEAAWEIIAACGQRYKS